MNGRLYAFRLSATAPVWVIIGHARGWIRDATQAAKHKVDLNDVAIVDSTSPLWTLPTTGQVP